MACDGRGYHISEVFSVSDFVNFNKYVMNYLSPRQVNRGPVVVDVILPMSAKSNGLLANDYNPAFRYGD
jgi:hypothetical protein